MSLTEKQGGSHTENFNHTLDVPTWDSKVACHVGAGSSMTRGRSTLEYLLPPGFFGGNRHNGIHRQRHGDVVVSPDFSLNDGGHRGLGGGHLQHEIYVYHLML